MGGLPPGDLHPRGLHPVGVGSPSRGSEVCIQGEWSASRGMGSASGGMGSASGGRKSASGEGGLHPGGVDQTPLRDTVKKRAVRILLECILVECFIS